MEGGSSSSSGEGQIKNFRPIDMPSTSRAHYEESPPTPKEHFHRSDSVPRLEDLIAGDSRLEELYNGDPAPSKQTIHEEDDDDDDNDEMRHGDDFNPQVRCCPQGHSLAFLAEPPYSCGKFLCNRCRKDTSGPVYHCRLCKFDLCPSCASTSTSSSTSTSGAISHPLPVIDSTITPWPSDVQETCPPLLNCGNVYHSLELLPSPPYPGGAYTCDLCLKEGEGQHYHCTSCRDFDLHPACARITTEIKSFAHPHGLVLQPPYSRGVNAMCDGCLEGLAGSQWVYRCSTGCDFDLHALCSKLAQKIRHPIHPDHELILHDHSVLGPYVNVMCDGCDYRIDPKELVYHCDDCGFDLHPSCAIGQDILRS